MQILVGSPATTSSSRRGIRMLGMPPSLDRATISSLNHHTHSPQSPPVAAWASNSLHSLFRASCNRHRHPYLARPPSLVSCGCRRHSILSWLPLLLLARPPLLHKNHEIVVAAPLTGVTTAGASRDRRQRSPPEQQQHTGLA